MIYVYIYTVYIYKLTIVNWYIYMYVICICIQYTVVPYDVESTCLFPSNKYTNMQ